MGGRDYVSTHILARERRSSPYLRSACHHKSEGALEVTHYVRPLDQFNLWRALFLYDITLAFACQLSVLLRPANPANSPALCHSQLLFAHY